MARGGKRTGAGRPTGSVTRPQLRNYFTEKDRKEVVEMLKTHMVDDMVLLKFVAEQLFGKAPQSVHTEDEDGKVLPITGVVFMNDDAE